MRSDGQLFLQHLEGFPRFSFEARFLDAAIELGLASKLTLADFKLLYEASLYASFCNLAFNGLGGCNGEIRPENETNRMGLELQFMAARDCFFATRGWSRLNLLQRKALRDGLLSVSVAEHNLAT